MEKFMKQKSKYILIPIFIVIIIYLLFNYFIKNIEEDLMNPYIEYPTYTFSGRSEHFKFDTGKVYFTNKYSQILISDFLQTKKINKLKNERVIISFADKNWSSLNNSKNLNKLEKYITEFQFYEAGILCENDSGVDCEKTAFNLANKDNFKDIIKIFIEYCTTDDICLKEQFEINYTNEQV